GVLGISLGCIQLGLLLFCPVSSTIPIVLELAALISGHSRFVEDIHRSRRLRTPYRVPVNVPIPLVLLVHIWVNRLHLRHGSIKAFWITGSRGNPGTLLQLVGLLQPHLTRKASHALTRLIGLRLELVRSLRIT